MRNVVAAMVFAPRPWERGLVCKGSLALRIWQDANGLQGMFHPLLGPHGGVPFAAGVILVLSN